MTRLGNGLYSAGRLKEAQAQFVDAVVIWRALVTDGATDFQNRLVRGLRHLADSYKGSDKAEAAKLYEEAITLGEQTADDPRELAFSLYNLSTIRASEGSQKVAAVCLERCCDLLNNSIKKGFTRMTEDPHSPALAPILNQAQNKLRSMG